MKSKKYKLQSVLIFASIILSSSVMSGCGARLTVAEEGYIKDCQTVRKNFRNYASVQFKIEKLDSVEEANDWVFWGTGTAVLIEGQKSRDQAEDKIYASFPWIKPSVEAVMAGTSKMDFVKQDSEAWATKTKVTEIGLMSEILKDTNLKLDFTVLERVIDKSNYGLNGDAFVKLLGTFSPSTRFRNCDDALGLKGFESLKSKFNLVSSRGVPLERLGPVAIDLWGCRKFGVGFWGAEKVWDKCSQSDFDFQFTQSTEPTEEEIAILAERKKSVEEEAQKPSNPVVTLDVRPGQICSNFRQVVQSESYGSLTCKLVWLYRIKALVWMRS